MNEYKCTKAPGRIFTFLGHHFRRAGSHKYKIKIIEKFMPCSSNFIVEYECEYCGAWYTRNFVSVEELLSKGVKIETLKSVGRNRSSRIILQADDYENGVLRDGKREMDV